MTSFHCSNVFPFFVTVAASVLSFRGNNESCEGEPVNLTCDVQGNPVPFVELVNNTDGQLLLSATSRSLTYTISKVDKTHVGTYNCSANNTIGPKVSKVFTIDHVFGRYIGTFVQQDTNFKV